MSDTKNDPGFEVVQSATDTQTPKELRVASIMTAKVFCVSPDMTVRDAINLLVKNHIAGAPVCDNQKVVLSVVSEGDLLKLAARMGMDKPISQCLPKLVKTEKLHTIKKTESFADAYKKFLTHPVHRLIVVDDQGKLQGIVSRSNVLRVLADPPEATSTPAPDAKASETPATPEAKKAG